MIKSLLVPVLYPLMPKELPVQVTSENGIIHSIHATINNLPVEFKKTANGEFIIAIENQIDKAYMAYIIRLLNRMFGGS